MKIFKLCFTFFLYLTITACSSTSNTKQANVTPQSNNYYPKNFSHYEFTTNNIDSIKKPASSDQELMISLLNRPMPEDQRMNFVAIVTPNHMHFPVAKAALEAGFHVMSDKPATLDLAEVLELNELLLGSQSLYALTHTYTGYPMVKEARHQVV